MSSGLNIAGIVAFKENLRVLLISALFIILSARLPLDQHEGMWTIRNLAFLAVLIVIGRPLDIALCTTGSALPTRERLFLAWLAPRGIIAAAVSSTFALELEESGYAEAGRLVPLAFFVIVGTVAIYGLTAAPVARYLGVRDSSSPLATAQTEKEH